MSWTNPYFGVSHLNGVRREFQITVNDYGSFALLHVFTPGRGFSAKETHHENAGTAMSAGEAEARALGAMK